VSRTKRIPRRQALPKQPPLSLHRGVERVDHRAAVVRGALCDQEPRTAAGRQDRLYKAGRGRPVALARPFLVEQVAMRNLDHPKDLHAFALTARGDFGRLATRRPRPTQRAPLGKGDLIPPEEHGLELARALSDRGPGLLRPCLAWALVLLIGAFGRDTGRVLIREAEVGQEPADRTRVGGDPACPFDDPRNQT
jgi:hypothetical protein